MTQPTLTPEAEYTLIRRALRGDAPVSDADKRRYEAVRGVFESGLTHKQAEAVTLRYIKQMFEKDIAIELGRTQPSVSLRLKHARKRFARALEMAG